MNRLLKDEVDSLLYSFEYVSLISFHKTTMIESFQTIIDENRYVFKNLGSDTVKFVILPPRPRELERELKIYDRNHGSIPLIEPEEANSLFIGMCKRILDISMNDLKGSNLEGRFREIKVRLERNLDDIFMLSGDEEWMRDLGDLGEILRQAEPGYDRFIFLTLRLIPFLKDYIERKYNPLVFLKPENRYQELILIDESVKQVGEFLPSGAAEKFRFFGNFEFLYEIEPKPSIPCGYAVNTPRGLVMKNLHFSFGGGVEDDYNEKKNKYFDSDYFHLTLDGKASEEISKCEEKIISISFGLSDRGFNLGILTILFITLWLCVLFPFLSSSMNVLLPNYFPEIDLALIYYLSLIGISTPIIVAIAVYAIDKGILRDFIANQILLLIEIFLIELFCLETNVVIFLKALLIVVFLIELLFFEMKILTFLKRFFLNRFFLLFS